MNYNYNIIIIIIIIVILKHHKTILSYHRIFLQILKYHIHMEMKLSEFLAVTNYNVFNYKHLDIIVSVLSDITPIITNYTESEIGVRMRKILKTLSPVL